MEVRVATLNVRGTHGGWAARRPILRQGFEEQHADLITLQETVVIDGYVQAREFLGTGYHLVHQRNREADGLGVTTASRWPVGQVVEVDLRLGACLVIEVLAPEPWGRIWLANHRGHERERRVQAVAVARTLERLNDHRPGRVVVAGDLDAEPGAGSVRFWTGRQELDGFGVSYRDAWESVRPGEPGHTFVPEGPHGEARRSDYILVRRGGPASLITGCERIFDRSGERVGDHCGLVAELTVGR